MLVFPPIILACSRILYFVSIFGQGLDGVGIQFDELIDCLLNVAVDKVVFDDVDEVERLVAGREELDAILRALVGFGVLLCRLRLVDDTPGSGESLEGLILPDFEGVLVDNGGLDDFSAREHAPGDGIDLVTLIAVGDAVTGQIHSLVGDGRLGVEVVLQQDDELGR